MDILSTILFLIGCLALFGSTYILYQSVQNRIQASQMLEDALDLDEESRERLMQMKHVQALRPSCPAVAVSDWKGVMANLESMQDFERLAVLHEAIKGKKDDDFVPPPQGFWSFSDHNGHIMIQLI